MIAIQPAAGGFSDRWINYCEANKILYKTVNCYRNDIITQLEDCNALMWQFYQGSPKDNLVASQILSAAEAMDIKVFPDFNTRWHFDDKVGQKYLLEAVGAPLVTTWIFYNRKEAVEWTAKTSYPIVFKLRGGAGSQNVRLVENRVEAVRLINKAFGCGFQTYDPLNSLKERWRLFRLNKTNLMDVIEGVVRFVVPPPYARMRGPERGYVYFQDYIANNDHDTRVVVIGNKAFAIKRMVRHGDFRASGSGSILYDKNLFEESTIKLSFTLAENLKSQCVAFDFVHNQGKPLVVEISYGFSPEGYDACPGFWDHELNWHQGKFDPYGWMVEDLLKEEL